MEPPLENIIQLLNGYRISQALSVAAQLGIADHLANGSMAPHELAALVSAKVGPLYQVLRFCASYGVFVEDNAGRFANTPMSECLRGDLPGAARNLALAIGNWNFQAFGEMKYAVQTGKPAFEKRFGRPFFDYLSAHQEFGQLFDSHMTSLYQREVEAVLEAFDFGSFGRILDVGGGRGTVVRALLARFPELQCGLFDLPAVAERTRERFSADGLSIRCKIETGSFFEAVPGGYDTYLLKHVLHDWDEVACKLILTNIRRVIGNLGSLLLLEYIVPPGNERSAVKGQDMVMLSLFAGRERKESEFGGLLDMTGFNLKRVVPSNSLICVLEAQPV
jgi:O-methyltransferase domain/Dimerisation domain